MTNFEKITKTQKALAEESVYVVYDKYSDGTEWMSVFIEGTWRMREEAVVATLQWLNKEVEK